MYATTRETLETTVTEFVCAACKWGLAASTLKMKGMAVGRELEPADVAPIHLDAGTIEFVKDFAHLGGSITSDGEVKVEVKSRIRKAARAFGCLQKIYPSKEIHIREN